MLRSKMANAFALPGGRVYVLSELLTKLETPDELAGKSVREWTDELRGPVDLRPSKRRR